MRWREDAEAGTLAGLRQVQRRVTDERFTSLSHFLRNPRWEATSNGAERAGRSFRHRQGAHYNLRSTVAIGEFMDVAAHERRHARSPAAELAVGRSRRGRRRERTEEELAAAALPTPNANREVSGKVGQFRSPDISRRSGEAAWQHHTRDQGAHPVDDASLRGPWTRSPRCARATS